MLRIESSILVLLYVRHSHTHIDYVNIYICLTYIMDLLIGIAIGSIVANIAQSSKQSGGTVAEEKQVVETIVQSKLKYPHIGRYINSFVDRV